MSKKAIVLLSGGMDSAVALAWAKHEGFELHALTFDYGQRHHIELEAAKRVSQLVGVASHRLFKVDLAQFGASALTDDIPVPKNNSAPEGIPITYVPARNTVFLALALALAESVGAHDLVIGANAVDYSGYPDCRPAFITAFEHLANVATRDGVMGQPFFVHAPLLALSKSEIVRLGIQLHVDFCATISCYDPNQDGRPCGGCDSCRLRAKGFAEAAMVDPAQSLWRSK